MNQLIMHLLGDFAFQNDFMAANKNKYSLNGWLACIFHCFVYTFLFIGLTRSIPALGLIFISHFIIDKFSIAVKWCNFFEVGKRLPSDNWIKIYLIFMVDMSFHLGCNAWILNRF